MRLNGERTTDFKRRVLLPLAAAALGVSLLAGCAGASEPAPDPTQTETSSPEPTETEEPANPETPVSDVEKTREWNITPEFERKLEQLGLLSQGIGEGDIHIVRTEVCNELLANNPLEGDFGPASPSDDAETVERRFEAKQQLLRDYISDRFRDDQWRSDVNAADMLAGARLCLTNGLPSKGSSSDDYGPALDNDTPVPSVTTRLDYAAGHEYDDRGFRWVTVTVAVEGQEIGEPLHRRHQWNHLTNDWDLINEQTENPGMGGWIE